ncbi:cell division transport system permease protein [Desulfitispora alkaliphila]|uniref:permease-like cell division protein FtsX n=1 Tax=Desulfitispora alkaliphila TaxID=622674 RepID=UPI003D236E0B
MKTRTFSGLLIQGFKSLWRNGWMSLASIGTVTITLFLFGMFFLLILNTNYIADTVESDVEIAAFLDMELDQEQVEVIGQRLENINGVESVLLVTKEEALEDLQQQFGRDHDLVGALDGKNPLPDYYRIKTEEPHQVALIATAVERMVEVDEVRYGQEVVDQLFSVTKWVRIVGAIIMGLLSLAAVFLIATTIRLTVFARRQEIGIMKLVGATNWYIRWPFILEGTFLGLLGSVLAISVLSAAYFGLIGQLQTAMPFIPFIGDSDNLIMLFVGMLVAGMVLGAIGSLVSLRKFLKV